MIYIVSGAGTNSFNGTYHESGTYGGKTAYTQNGLWLIWSTTAGRWIFNTIQGDIVAYYSGTGATLPANPWLVGIGLAPAPTVAVASKRLELGLKYGKKYLYKIYNKDGKYITTWKDVGIPRFSYKINSGYSDLTVNLAREFYDFGEGNDVLVGNQLKLVVSDAEAPGGILIYNGELTKYHLLMGKKQTVEVTFTGYITELAKRIVVDGSDTKIEYSTEDPTDIIKDVIDKVGNKVTYDEGSMANTGLSVSWDCIQNTALEVIQRMKDISPTNWYWYVDKDNKLQFHEYKTDNIIKLFIGNHIKSLEMTKTSEQLFNTYFFLGGGSPQLYKKYERTSSQDTYGQKDKREQDERITVAGTASDRGTSFLNEHESPAMEVICDVIDSNIDPKRGVDIDNLRPGQCIQILHPDVDSSTTKWDAMTWDIDFWDYNASVAIGQPLRLEQIDYYGTGARLKLGAVLPQVADIINQNTIQLETFRGKDSPDAPS